MLVFIVCSVVAAVLLWRWAQWSPAGNMPGPGGFEGIPVIGAVVTLYNHVDDFLDWLLAHCKELGPVWTFWIVGQPRFVIITDPLDVRHVLKDNFDNYVKGEDFFEKFQELLGHGIFNSDGDAWYVQRKTASPLFNVRNFRTHMVDVFVRHGLELCAKLDEHVRSGEPVDLHKLFYAVTLDAIGPIGFGTEINSLRGDSEFATAFDNAQRVIQLRFLSPIWKLRKLFAPDEWQFRQHVPVVSRFAERIVRQRLDELAQQNEQGAAVERHDLLSLFIKKGIEMGTPFSERYLRDLVVNFIVAGRDTTAGALSWQFFELMDHPDVVSRLRAEIDEQIGEQQLPNYASLKKLAYGEATFKECLRLHPSVPKDAKQAIAPDRLPSGFDVPAGAWLTYLPWVMGRLPQLWGDDCEQFKPQRFIDEPEPNQFRWPVFNAGPRLCLGKQMATLEAKVITCLLLQRFDFELAVPRSEITYLTNITLPMKNGMLVRVKHHQK